MDLTSELMLDGNAVAGLLHSVFAMEVTGSPTECATCGRKGAIGDLWAFTQAPGVVLRCPSCHNVVLRLVETDRAVYLDARGAAFIKFEKRVA